MGTTEGAIQSAVNLGISRSNTFQYADSGAGTKLASVSRNVSKSLYFASVIDNAPQTENLVDSDSTTDSDS